MIVVNLLYFSIIHCFFLFTWVFKKPVYDVLAPWQKKKLWATCTFFWFCLVRFECFVFCLYWIKTKPHFANKAKPFFTEFFISQESYVCLFLKSILCFAWRDLGTSLLLCPSHLFVSLFLLRKFALILSGTRFRKNKQTKFVYFLETTMYKCLIFWINTMIRINLVVNSVLFWLEVMPGSLSLDLRKAWVNDIRFSTIVCTNN